MKNRKELQQELMRAASDQGVSTVLFRNAIGRRLGLSVTDGECLSFLTLRGTATPSELAKYTGLTSGSATAMLDRLEKNGYITRQPNPDDRRGSLVVATSKWRELASPLLEGVQAAHQALLGRYSDEELAVIVDFLQGFAQNIHEQASIVGQSQTQ